MEFNPLNCILLIMFLSTFFFLSASMLSSKISADLREFEEEATFDLEETP